MVIFVSSLGLHAASQFFCITYFDANAYYSRFRLCLFNLMKKKMGFDVLCSLRRHLSVTDPGGGGGPWGPWTPPLSKTKIFKIEIQVNAVLLCVGRQLRLGLRVGRGDLAS